MFENLETRRLFAITVSGGVANLNSYFTTGNDVRDFVLNGSTLQIRDGAGTVLASISASGITGVSVNANNGNDFFRMGRADGTLMPNVTATIHGGAGDDTLIGGNKADQIFGDDNNDKMDGRAAGDQIDGGNGFDTVDYGARTVNVTVTLNDATANDGSNSGNNSSPAQYNDNGADKVLNTEGVIGGTGADKLVGSSAANWLDGGGGIDSVYGGDGIDTITGGVAADLAYGEGGDDYFFVTDATGDKFLGGTGTTFANYDVNLDTPAPALPSSPSGSAGLASAAALIGPLVVPNAAAQSGRDFELDTTFGTGTGIVNTDINGVQINDVTIESVGDDEKILVVGSASFFNSEFETTETRAVLIRYNSDGSLDSTFGDDGIVSTDFSGGEGFDSTAASVVIDSNGRIVIGGTEAFEEDVDSIFAMARYDSSGNLDSTFGNNGISTFGLDESFSSKEATQVALQDHFDGTDTTEDYILLGTIGPEIFSDAVPAFSADSDTFDWAMIRVDQSGNQDFDFGDDGLTRLDYFGNDDFATGLAIDPQNNNTIWVSGTTNNGSTNNILVAAFDEDGVVLPGVVNKVHISASDQANDSFLLNGQLYVVGKSDTYGSGAVFDFNADPESGFDLAQLVNSRFIFDSGAVNLQKITYDGEGHLVLSGTNGSAAYLYRIDGNLNDFGTPISIDDFDQPVDSDSIFTAVVQSDGKIVLGGSVGDPQVALARVQESAAFVDVPITDVQSFNFTYTDGTGTHPLPTYLTERVTDLKPDGTFELSGTNQADIITVKVQDGNVVVVINGEIFQQPQSLVTKVVIHGLDGNDLITVDPAVTIPVNLDGGKGNDSLIGGNGPGEFHGGDGDDSIIGGNSDDVMYGDAGKDTIKGGKGNDIVEGGAGNDSIQGNDGRDILVGGLDNDRLDGGAGDDILDGGSTNYDNNPAALAALLREWTRTDADYNTRVTHISNGTGLNTPFKLDVNTVHSGSGNPDTLTGGADKDFFFMSAKGDVATDRVSTEKLVTVHA
ncbi:MAG TPA: hypothetical protein VHD56_08770 [Tepidisphaeraceae bacterium]|nr:hypothetical protein [Tepidisphaeraceae bacterium]